MMLVVVNHTSQSIRRPRSSVADAITVVTDDAGDVQTPGSAYVTFDGRIT